MAEPLKGSALRHFTPEAEPNSGRIMLPDDLPSSSPQKPSQERHRSAYHALKLCGLVVWLGVIVWTTVEWSSGYDGDLIWVSYSASVGVFLSLLLLSDNWALDLLKALTLGFLLMAVFYVAIVESVLLVTGARISLWEILGSAVFAAGSTSAMVAIWLERRGRW